MKRLVWSLASMPRKMILNITDNILLRYPNVQILHIDDNVQITRKSLDCMKKLRVYCGGPIGLISCVMAHQLQVATIHDISESDQPQSVAINPYVLATNITQLADNASLDNVQIFIYRGSNFTNILPENVRILDISEGYGPRPDICDKMKDLMVLMSAAGCMYLYKEELYTILTDILHIHPHIIELYLYVEFSVDCDITGIILPEIDPGIVALHSTIRYIHVHVDTLSVHHICGDRDTCDSNARISSIITPPVTYTAEGYNPSTACMYWVENPFGRTLHKFIKMACDEGLVDFGLDRVAIEQIIQE